MTRFRLVGGGRRLVWPSARFVPSRNMRSALLRWGAPRIPGRAWRPDDMTVAIASHGIRTGSFQPWRAQERCRQPLRRSACINRIDARCIWAQRQSCPGRVVDILEACGAFDPGSSPGRGVLRRAHFLFLISGHGLLDFVAGGLRAAPDRPSSVMEECHVGLHERPATAVRGSCR